MLGSPHEIALEHHDPCTGQVVFVLRGKSRNSISIRSTRKFDFRKVCAATLSASRCTKTPAATAEGTRETLQKRTGVSADFRLETCYFYRARRHFELRQPERQITPATTTARQTTVL